MVPRILGKQDVGSDDHIQSKPCSWEQCISWVIKALPYDHRRVELISYYKNRAKLLNIKFTGIDIQCCIKEVSNGNPVSQPEVYWIAACNVLVSYAERRVQR
uniref:Uncharacterized protein n=1 Tax=Oryza rufipogon TaxID=4529 RepID=A0A0E0MTA0_ORYRU